MKTITKQFYQCELCNHEYENKEAALRCESRPVKYADVKIGDTVKILSGGGAGKLLKVDKIWTIEKDWGHYLADRYWHTQLVSGQVQDSWGSRVLTFEAYEKEQP